MSYTIGTTSMLTMRAVSLVLMMFVVLGAFMGTLTSLYIVLEAKNLLMMVMGQD